MRVGEGYMELTENGTEKINSRGEEISTHITPELTIGALVYVDDMLGIGDRKTVKNLYGTPED